MTKPPERIYAYSDNTGYRFAAKGKQEYFDSTEYVRADILDEAEKRAYWQGTKDGAQSERDDIMLGSIANE